MNSGRIEQQGTPLQISEHPATPFVREFLDGATLAPRLV
jgi:ABC-type Fe3+/spermidine/putrescine transport system ATPase subunit